MGSVCKIKNVKENNYTNVSFVTVRRDKKYYENKITDDN